MNGALIMFPHQSWLWMDPGSSQPPPLGILPSPLLLSQALSIMATADPCSSLSRLFSHASPSLNSERHKDNQHWTTPVAMHANLQGPPQALHAPSDMQITHTSSTLLWPQPSCPPSTGPWSPCPANARRLPTRCRNDAAWVAPPPSSLRPSLCPAAAAAKDKLLFSSASRRVTVRAASCRPM